MTINRIDQAYPSPPAEPWVDAATVAKHIGFCQKTTVKMVAQGKLPGRAVRNGAKTFWRFKLSEVDVAIRSIDQK
jgi:hypothetical protein